MQFQKHFNIIFYINLIDFFFNLLNLFPFYLSIFDPPSAGLLFLIAVYNSGKNIYVTKMWLAKYHGKAFINWAVYVNSEFYHFG